MELNILKVIRRSARLFDGFKIELIEKMEDHKKAYFLICEKDFPIYDRRKITGPTKWTVPISEKEVRSLLAMLKRPIPSMPEWAMGLDGETFELIVEQGSNSAHYVWWGGIPKGWKRLGEVVERIISLSKLNAL